MNTPTSASPMRSSTQSTLIGIELLGYVGLAVALVGTGVAVGPNVSDGVAAFVSLVVALVALAAGVVLVSPTSDQLRRMKSVLWFLSVLGVSQFTSSIVGDIGEGKVGPFFAALLTAVFAGALWWVHRRTLQQLAFYSSAYSALLIIALPDFGNAFFGIPSLTGVFFVTLLSGIAWFVLGWRGIVTPTRTAMVVGELVVLTSPIYLFTNTDLLTLLILVFSVVALVVGELLADRALSGIAVAGLLIGTLSFSASLLGDARTGGAIAALVIGLVLLASALLLGRTTGVVTPQMPFGLGGGGPMPPPPGPSAPPSEPPPSEPPSTP